MEARNKIQSQNSLDKIPQAYSRGAETSKPPKCQEVFLWQRPRLPNSGCVGGGHFQQFLHLLPHCTPCTPRLLEAPPPPLFPCLHRATEISKRSTLGCPVEIRKWPGSRPSSRAPGTPQSLTQCSFLVSLPVCCSAREDGRMKGLMFNTVAVYGLAAAGYRLSLRDHHLF